MICNIDECSIYKTEKILKHKWNPIIIYVLNCNSLTFGELDSQIKYVSHKRLSTSLKMLEECEIIEKYNNKYSLTTIGQQAFLIVKMMEELGLFFD